MKKAALDMTINQGTLITRIVFMLFVALSIVMLVRLYVAVEIDIQEAEANTILGRFAYSPECFMLDDAKAGGVVSSGVEKAWVVSGRPYPGIVDLDRFNNASLDSCISYGASNDYSSAKLTLKVIASQETHEAYLNPGGYAILKPKDKQKGPGGAKSYSETRYVLAEMDGKLEPALLTAEVVMPNQ